MLDGTDVTNNQAVKSKGGEVMETFSLKGLQPALQKLEQKWQTLTGILAKIWIDGIPPRLDPSKAVVEPVFRDRYAVAGMRVRSSCKIFLSQRASPSRSEAYIHPQHNRTRWRPPYSRVLRI